MRKDDNNGSLENASEIIERFGGIRPMSKKIDVAVTTIQGWKKRDVIPEARRDDVLQAAARHDIDLSDVVSGLSPANENVMHLTGDMQAREQATKELEDEISESVYAQIKASEKTAVNKSIWMSSLLVLIAASVVIFMMWPQQQKIVRNSDRITQLQEKLDEVKQGQSSIGGLVPESVQEQFSGLQRQARNIQQQIADVARKAESVSQGVLGGGVDAADIQKRLAQLERQVGAATQNFDLNSWYQKISNMQSSPDGQKILGYSANDLYELVGRLQGNKAPLEQELAEAKTEEDELGYVLEGVNNNDLKAAALLLGLNQFRNALNREDTFENDLALMQSMLGEDNPALNEAIIKLSPHAKDGVLSYGGLSDQFKGLAGDIVVSSLKGEDVSIQEKAKARFNEVLSVKKDGELITGTDTQAKVARAQIMLDDGNIEGAIAELQSLEGEAAQTAQPWIDDAQASLLAGDVEDMMTSTVIDRLTAPQNGFSVSGAGTQLINQIRNFTPGRRMIRSGNSDFMILAPDPDFPNIPLDR